MNETQKYLKSIGFRLNKDLTEEERQRRKEEWKNLIIGRKSPHRGVNMADHLKSCPFCGEDYEVWVGVTEDPTAFWDSRMRGGKYYYVKCANCDVIMKGQSFNEVVE